MLENPTASDKNSWNLLTQLLSRNGKVIENTNYDGGDADEDDDDEDDDDDDHDDDHDDDDGDNDSNERRDDMIKNEVLTQKFYLEYSDIDIVLTLALNE